MGLKKKIGAIDS